VFPELALAATVALPDGCVLDGELVSGADAGFVVSDLLAVGHRDLRRLSRAERRLRLAAEADGWPPMFRLAPRAPRLTGEHRRRARPSRAPLEPVP
jgi:hypothetical protein